ncbi:hypothetical protein [Microcoleus sp. AT3-D2]|uniref:hypothetical protein n=1 Tax=Microcoleus sp. AT3-D2 TaxID=2818612 RepID=UPI002FCFB39D
MSAVRALGAVRARFGWTFGNQYRFIVANLLSKKLSLLRFFKNQNNMLSQLPGIYFLLGAALSNVSLLISSIINNNFVLGAALSSLALLISNCINNNFQLKREREQRIWQEESERQKWYREQIYENYRKMIHILTSYLQLQFETENERTVESIIRIHHLYFEFSSEFYMTTWGHPNKDSEEFKKQTNEVLDNFQNDPVAARLMIINIMEEDPRIKDVNK